MSRLFRRDLRATTDPSRIAGRGKTPSRGPRRMGLPWQVFRTGFERLEDRTLLAGGISAGQVTAINQGLGALSGLGTQLNSFQELGQSLNLLNTSLSQVLDIGQTLSDDLGTPASAYLGQATPTVSGLATALTSTTTGNKVTVTGSDDGSGNLTFQVSVDVTKTSSPLPLGLGPQAQALGVTTTATATVVLRRRVRR